MKTLSKKHTNQNGFKGWTHFYEDGPLIQNESINDNFIVQISIEYIYKLRFTVSLLDNDYETVLEYQTDTLDITELNQYLQSINTNYKLQLSIDEYFELLHQETI